MPGNKQSHIMAEAWANSPLLGYIENFWTVNSNSGKLTRRLYKRKRVDESKIIRCQLDPCCYRDHWQISVMGTQVNRVV